jgi:phospholipase/lecithinase/hemolysin
MEQEVTQTTPDAFDAAVTSASTYAEPAVTTEAEVETPVEQPSASRDDKGRFAAQKAEAVDDAVVETSAKPVAKPRNDPQARIDQVIKEREEARAGSRALQV